MLYMGSRVASGHHVHVRPTPCRPQVHVCQWKDDKPHWTVGGPNSGTRFCIYRLRESCRDDTDGLLHAWAGLTEASIRGSWSRRHISSSVRRPSLPVSYEIPLTVHQRSSKHIWDVFRDAWAASLGFKHIPLVSHWYFIVKSALVEDSKQITYSRYHFPTWVKHPTGQINFTHQVRRE